LFFHIPSTPTAASNPSSGLQKFRFDQPKLNACQKKRTTETTRLGNDSNLKMGERLKYCGPISLDQRWSEKPHRLQIDSFRRQPDGNHFIKSPNEHAENLLPV
jgi:hypothetical protein